MKPATATPPQSQLRVPVSRLALAVALVLSGLSPGTVAADKTDTDQRVEEIVIKPAQLDWVSIRQVPRELRDRRCENCRGRYIDPLAGAREGPPPKEADIQANAASTELRGDEVDDVGTCKILSTTFTLSWGC